MIDKPYSGDHHARRPAAASDTASGTVNITPGTMHTSTAPVVLILNAAFVLLLNAAQ
ncbi:hypothetical protein [Dactylosporangium sp. CA-139066]|uniref:hypothetical protein n=1 Tax=Dactylosporangium sp. CA-139066 TaxID=3239930 RepID=UPI003D93A038